MLPGADEGHHVDKTGHLPGQLDGSAALMKCKVQLQTEP